LPGRRVLVENAGDPDFNGVYHCTDANGNVSKHTYRADRGVSA